jgi:hypothetical protein
MRGWKREPRMQLAVDREHLVERYTVGSWEFLCLDSEIVILKLPSEILRSDHGRRETTKSILVCDVESRCIVYRGTFVASIQGGHLHIAKGNLCGAIDPADVYWSREGDDCRKYPGMGDLMKHVNMRRPRPGLRTVPCMNNWKL